MTDMRTIAVVKPAPSQDLLTLVEARDELRTPRKDDSRVRRYIADASVAIGSYTRRVWRQEQVTETFHRSWFEYYHWHHVNRHRIDGGPIPLVLKRYPVVSVDQVVITDGSESLTSSDWVIDGKSGLLYRQSDSGQVTGWYGTVAVTYTAGYANPGDIPPDVRQACLTLIRHRYSSATRDPALRSLNIPGVQEETYWVGATGENGAIPPEVAGLLIGHIDMRS